jgi:hypothetical protein
MNEDLNKGLNIYPSKATIEVDSMFLLCYDKIREFMDESFDTLDDVLTVTHEETISDELGIEFWNLPPDLMHNDIESSGKQQQKQIILYHVIQLLNSIGI